MAVLRKLIVFLFLLIIVLILSYFITGEFFPEASMSNIWFYSGIVMVLVSQFFIEPYYSAPSNVTINSLSIILVMLSVYGDLKGNVLGVSVASAILIYCTTLFFLSMVSVAMASPDHSAQSLRVRVSNLAKELSVAFGRGKVVYSVVFFAFLLLGYSVTDPNILFLIVFWAFFILVDPQRITPKIIRVLRKGPEEIGEVIGVQSKKMFLARLFNDRSRSESVGKFDPVSFKYSMRDQDTVYEGIIFDKYLLNRQKWIKILLIDQRPSSNYLKRENVICKVPKGSSPKIEDFLRRFVGIVAEDSSIGRILFEYSTTKIEIQEGDLLEVRVGNHSVLDLTL